MFRHTVTVESEAERVVFENGIILTVTVEQPNSFCLIWTDYCVVNICKQISLPNTSLKRSRATLSKHQQIQNICGHKMWTLWPLRLPPPSRVLFPWKCKSYRPRPPIQYDAFQSNIEFMTVVTVVRSLGRGLLASSVTFVYVSPIALNG